MASILSSLPAPAREYTKPAPEPQPHGALAMRGVKEPPSYGRRAGFVPRRLEDFGEGAHRAHQDCPLCLQLVRLLLPLGCSLGV